MKKYVAIIYTLVISFYTLGCSKENLEKIDLEAIKKETVEKREELKNIQEKVKKIKKKL